MNPGPSTMTPTPTSKRTGPLVKASGSCVARVHKGDRFGVGPADPKPQLNTHKKSPQIPALEQLAGRRWRVWQQLTTLQATVNRHTIRLPTMTCPPFYRVYESCCIHEEMPRFGTANLKYMSTSQL